MRVKPSASRQQSAEIYYLCLDYDNSENEAVVRAKELKKRLEKAEAKERMAEEDDLRLSKQDREESDQLYKELF